MKTLLLILLVVMAVSCDTVANNEYKEPGSVVLSWQKMDFSSLNDKILEASNSHQGWVKDIQLYVFHLFGLSGLKKVVYESEFDNIENPTKATVTLVRDGFLDDAVRGDIHIITFHRSADGHGKLSISKSRRDVGAQTRTCMVPVFAPDTKIALRKCVFYSYNRSGNIVPGLILKGQF